MIKFTVAHYYLSGLICCVQVLGWSISCDMVGTTICYILRLVLIPAVIPRMQYYFWFSLLSVHRVERDHFRSFHLNFTISPTPQAKNSMWRLCQLLSTATLIVHGGIREIIIRWIHRFREFTVSHTQSRTPLIISFHIPPLSKRVQDNALGLQVSVSTLALCSTVFGKV